MELGGLTERERQIASYLTRGFFTREIAREMNVNKRLIDFTVNRLFEKVGAKDRRDFILAWLAMEKATEV